MKTTTKVIGAVLAAAVLLLGGFVAATWAPGRPVSALQARWAPPPSVFLKVAGMDVHLRDEGPRDDPRPLVLLHGTSSSLHTWDGWAEALKAQRRVIRFDLPGFGLTGPTPHGAYSIESYVRFVTTVLDRLGVQRCVLAGNSLGGEIAWATALTHPERVDQLVLVDAAGYPLEPGSVPIGFRLARMPLLSMLLQFTLPRGMVESSVRNVYGDPSKVTDALVDRYFELTLRAGNRRALAERFAQRRPGAMADRIRGLKLPALILWGGRDRLIPPEHAERFHRDIAGSRLVVFDGLGHVPMEEDPAGTVAAVQDFLESSNCRDVPEAKCAPLNAGRPAPI